MECVDPAHHSIGVSASFRESQPHGALCGNPPRDLGGAATEQGMTKDAVGPLMMTMMMPRAPLEMGDDGATQ